MLVVLAVFLSFSGSSEMAAAAGGQPPPASVPGWTPSFLPAVGSMLTSSTGIDDLVALGDTGAAEPTQTYPYKQFLPVIRGGVGSEVEAPFGVHIYRKQPIIVSRTYEAGARWVRIEFNWNSIEPQNTTPDNYSWPAALDDHLAALSAQGIHVLLSLHNSPSWAATYPGGPIDLAPMSELVQFMTASVARYGAPPFNVKDWEIFNEPDNSWEIYAEEGWGYFGNNPQAYVDILSAIYGPMKATDPDANVVFGGLAHDWFDTDAQNPGPFVEDFVDDVLRLGGGAYFDVMNFHHYIISNWRWVQYGEGIIGKTASLRARMAAQQVFKPFICTESGMWSSDYTEPPGSDELQSRYVPQLFARSAAADLEFTIWYTLVDSPNVGEIKRGLLNADYSIKPAYVAYQTMAQQLGPTDFVRTLSQSETGSDQSEGYAFRTKDGSTNVYVAWTNDELQHNMSITASQVVVVDKYGTETILFDGSDGATDGKVTITLSPSPLYLRFAAGATR
jgi:hypothetical protein